MRAISRATDGFSAMIVFMFSYFLVILWILFWI
jgi:hypothetical protein